MSFSNGVINKGASLETVSEEVDNKSITPSKPAAEEQQTHWPSIYLLTAISLFAGVQFSIFFPTLWPFLNVVDPTASELFFGFITAAFSIGQGLASPAFGYWMNKTESIKQPLIFGTIVMIISNVIFCFVEAFHTTDRRWVMMVARFFIGMGAGTVGVMRAYASTASSVNDRARAITFVQASYVIGMTIGPGIPVAFAPIHYPGVTAGPFHLDMYTAPAWFASIINVLSLIFIFVFLEENYVGITEADPNENPFFALPNFDKIAVSVCVYTQFALMFIITNLETVGSMYAKAMWNWDNSQTVVNTGIMQAANGAVSLVFYGLFALKFGNYMSNGRERIFTILGLLLGVVFHVVTFPWPFLKHSLPLPSNITTKGGTNESIGCDPHEYSWCSTTKEVNFWVYASFYVIVLAACFPLVNIPMNTLFSKILGSRRQGTMQGIVLMSGSLARTLGPLLVSWLFEEKGPIPLWYIEVGVLGLCIIGWVIFYRRLVPLNPKPDMKPYQHYAYERGRLYRI